MKQSISRRQFLKASGLAAAGVCAAGLLSSCGGKSGGSSKSAAGIATYKELGISSSAVNVGASSSAKASKKPTNAQLK